MNLHESGEMYLETIYVLSKKKSAVRAVDICDEMGYSKPSVSRAMSILKKGEFIAVDESGYIKLTEDGLEIAEKIYQRHLVITEFLTSIGVDKETASSDACKMEHAVSDITFAAIKRHNELLQKK